MKFEKTKISVIIPVYNVESYLRECLDSVIGQTFKELEIICVDDGSKDSSGRILDEYASRDDRIKVIHKENSGYGHTMNVGMTAAVGKYIGIVESDDKIRPAMYERLYKSAERTGVDFVKSDFYEYYVGADGKDRTEYRSLYSNQSYYNKVIDSKDDYEIFKCSKCTWAGLYRTQFLKETHILHNETPGASYQDCGFWFQTMMKAEKFIFLKEAFYMYRIDNPNSSVHDAGKVFAIFDEYDFIRTKLQKMDAEWNKYSGLYTYFYLHDSLWHIRRLAYNSKIALTMRIREEYIAALQRKEVDADVFNIDMKKKIFEIAANPEKYCENLVAEERLITDITSKYQSIIIYGAGQIGRKVQPKLKAVRENGKILCFAVSSKENNEEEVLGIPVRTIDELIKYQKETLVIIAVSSRLYQEIVNKIEELGFQNYIYASELFKE